jgi:hypothetical protein
MSTCDRETNYEESPAPEGTVFLVPLRDKDYAVGVLARASGEGHCFGYFFGPRVMRAEEVDLNALSPEHAILEGKFGDLELLRGNWPIVGLLKSWDRNRWKILPLARIDEVSGRAWVSNYDDMFNCIEETEISKAEAAGFPYDRTMGAGAVEIRLTTLLQ